MSAWTPYLAMRALESAGFEYDKVHRTYTHSGIGDVITDGALHANPDSIGERALEVIVWNRENPE